MRHRIAAGAIIEVDCRLLLVHHQKQGAYDLWVAPSGGVEGAEDLRSAACREVREECGLDVDVGELAYIEEPYTAAERMCKSWFLGRIAGGSLCVSAQEAANEHIVEAAFLSRDEFDGRTVYPPVLREKYWRDKVIRFAASRYLGLREMRFDVRDSIRGGNS